MYLWICFFFLVNHSLTRVTLCLYQYNLSETHWQQTVSSWALFRHHPLGRERHRQIDIPSGRDRFELPNFEIEQKTSGLYLYSHSLRHLFYTFPFPSPSPPHTHTLSPLPNFYPYLNFQAAPWYIFIHACEKKVVHVPTKTEKIFS